MSFAVRMFRADGLFYPTNCHVCFGLYFTYIPELIGTLTNHTPSHITIVTGGHAKDAVRGKVLKQTRYLLNYEFRIVRPSCYFKPDTEINKYIDNIVINLWAR